MSLVQRKSQPVGDPPRLGTKRFVRQASGHQGRPRGASRPPCSPRTNHREEHHEFQVAASECCGPGRRSGTPERCRHRRGPSSLPFASQPRQLVVVLRLLLPAVVLSAVLQQLQLVQQLRFFLQQLRFVQQLWLVLQRLQQLRRRKLPDLRRHGDPERLGRSASSG